MLASGIQQAVQSADTPLSSIGRSGLETLDWAKREGNVCVLTVCSRSGGDQRRTVACNAMVSGASGDVSVLTDIENDSLVCL